ncbi:MAG: hypothetical protein QOG59_1979 [Solirubrobacteraceae bacterium]|nr:hypothetical protein [Solirubrobacteraceae bacterium]
MSEPFDLDLAAAGLRADTRDLPALVNALGVWLEEAVPGMAQVQRKRAGLLDSRKNVVRIRVRLGDDTYVLERDGAGASARRGREVRGITLKTEELTVPEWLSGLAGALVSHAAVSEVSATALRDLLT